MHPEDQLMQRVELTHRAEFYPLGFAVQLASLEAARQSWRDWTRAFDFPPVEMRVVLHLDGPIPEREPVYHASRHLLTIRADSVNFGTCDLQSGYFFSCVTPAVVSAPYFRNYMLETMVYLTLDYLYFTILHAGSVARNGRGVLLCGDAGIGKSCLAYACVKRGWTLLSDDFSAMLPDPGHNTIIGRPHSMRFRPGAFELFPELAGFDSSITPFGKHMFDLQTGAIPGVKTARCCRADAVVFLDRRESGGAELVLVDPDEALARFRYDDRHWDPPASNQHEQAIRALLDRGFHTLRYSDFDSAIRVMESLV
jgi:hypothetical protein